MSVLSGPTLQPGAFRSGVLGNPGFNGGAAQPGAYRSGSLGMAQPGAYNSGSLGFAQPGAYNSGSLGCGGGCSRGQAGLGTTVRQIRAGRRRRGISGLGAALGAMSLDMDFMVGAAVVFGALYFVDKKKGG